MSHDPLVLALMVAVLALQVSFKLLDARTRKKSNGTAGQMSKEAWMLIFNELFDEKLAHFDEKLDKMTDTLRKEVMDTRHSLRDSMQQILSAMYRKGGE